MFVVFHTNNPHADKRYFKTLAGAKRSARSEEHTSELQSH